MKKVWAERHRALAALAFGLWMCALNLSASETNGAVLTVGGAVKQRMEFTLADLRAMERVKANGSDRDGKEREFEGVRLWDVIQKALPFDIKEHKQVVNTCVVIKAKDGYQAVFALAELAPSISDKTVVLADRCEGKSLPEAEGLLRIVAPGEKMRSRWVRQVNRVEVISLLPRDEGK